MINYNNKVFKVLNYSEDGETGDDTTFYYFQTDNRVWASYQGGNTIQGQLLGLVDNKAVIEMRYHHINKSGDFLTRVFDSCSYSL